VRRWRRAGGVLAAALGLAAGCDGGGSGAEDAAAPLLVFAASDLQVALPEVVRAFEARSGGRVDVVYGSTGLLATQIEHGAPADVFLAAHERFVDRLDRGGHVLPGSRRTYALGRLALAWAPGTPPPRSPASLRDAAYGTVAIANPEHAPYGRAAREALEAAGVWDAVRGRVVLAENVAGALQFVRTGNADAALVALGAVTGVRGVAFVPVDAALHAPLRQVAAVPRTSRQPEAARAFLDALTGAEGQAALRRYGFEPPDRP
jgi:molybdate transport system substrate-binding protein